MEHKSHSKLTSSKSAKGRRGREAAMLPALSRELGIVRSKGRVTFPSIADQPVFQQRFRFKRTTAGMANVTADCIANLMFVARGSSTGTRLFGFVRLVKVEVWGDQAGNPGSSPNAVTLYFQSQDPNSAHESRTASFQDVGAYDRVAHICVHPGLLHDAAKTFATDTTYRFVLFGTAGQIGDVIDVVVEYALANPAVASPNAIATASTSAGLVYQNAILDNTNTSGVQGAGYLTNIGSWATAVGYG